MAVFSLWVSRRRIARVFLYRRSRGRSVWRKCNWRRSKKQWCRERRKSKTRSARFDRGDNVRTLGLAVELPEVLPLLLVDDGEDSGDGLSDRVARSQHDFPMVF